MKKSEEIIKTIIAETKAQGKKRSELASKVDAREDKLITYSKAKEDYQSILPTRC